MKVSLISEVMMVLLPTPSAQQRNNGKDKERIG
jgi:hypothetical protein